MLEAGIDGTCGVLEVGPGIGPLTAELAKRAGKVVSIELDRALLPVLAETVGDLPNVEIVAFSGLSVDFARQCKAKVIIRGLRAITDFEYELQMAQTNRVLAPDVDTMFLTTSLEYAYLSSTTVKEVAAFGGDISKFVPGFVMDEVHKKLKK